MVDNIKKNWHIFWLFALYSFKVTFRHPAGVVLFTIGKIIRFGMFFLFVMVLVYSTKVLVGYTPEQTIIFYLTYNIVDSISQLLFREVYRFRQLVISGEFDTVLVKPFHPFLKILVGGIDILDSVITLLYIGIAIFFIVQLPTFNFVHLILYFALIMNALVIATSFHIGVLALGILTTEVDHAIMIYRDMTRLGTFPIDIYKQPIRFFFTFIIPIGIMISIPVKSLLNVLTFELYIISFSFAIVCLFLSLKLWDYALKKYQSWGG